MSRRNRQPNRWGCKPTEDVCVEHDLPLDCRHGCRCAQPHSCKDRTKIKEGDIVQVRNNGFMQCRVRKVTGDMAECECSSNGDFSFGLVKTFRIVDLVKEA